VSTIAGKIKGITIEIGGDTQKLNKALEDVNKKTRDVQSELRQVERLLKLDPGNTDLLAQKQKLLAEAVENSREKLDRLRAAQQQVNEQFRKGEINEEQYRAFQREVVKAEQELAKFEKQLRETGLTAEQVGQKLKDAGQKMTDVGKNLTMKVTAPIVGLGTVAAKAAIGFESAFAGVRKTVDATEEEFAQLEQGIRDMAKQMPASATDIAAVAEAAGQLGIETDNILKFTETMIGLGEATNLTAEEGATQFARFANIVGMSQQDFDRLGSSVVALGNSLATTEAEIVEMGMRLAGQGAQIGMTEAQIMALAAAMSSVGIEAEAGGTAMSTTLKKMQTAVSLGGKDLEKFAQVARMSAAEFARAFQADPAAALQSFIDGLAESSAAGENLTLVLNDLGISGIRESDTLLRLAGANDVLRNALETSTTAWEENIALQNEVAQRYATTESQLAMFKNSILDLGITLGEIIIPALISLVDAIRPVVDWLANLSPQAQKAIIAIAGIAAAIGPLLLILGPVVSAIGTLVTGLGAMSAAMAGGASIVAGLTAGFPVLGSVIGALTGPIGLVIAAIAGLIAIGVLLYKNWDGIKAFFINLWNKVKEITINAISSIKNAISDLVEVGKNIVIGIWEGIKSMGTWLYDKVATFVKENIVGTVKKFLGIASPSKVMAEFGRYVAEGLARGMEEGTSEVAKKAQQMAQAISNAVQKMTGELSNALNLSNARLELQKELLGDNAEEYEKLALELEKLNNEKENLIGRIDVLTAAYETAKKELGENNEATKQYAYELEMAQIELQKMEVSIRKTSVAIEEQKKKAIEAARRQAQELRNLADEVTNVEKKYREDLAAAAEEYQKKVQEVNNKLIEDERRVTEEYEKAVEARAKSLRDFVGLFDAVTKKEISGEQLLKNLRGQVEAFENWQENIADLAAKGVDEGLIEELRQMGPKAGPEIAALNTLTDEQLAEYVTLWRRKNEEARAEAVNQLQQQREEMQQKLIEIRIAAQEQLEAYRVEWEKKNAEIRKNAEEEMKRIEEKFQSIAKAGTTYGVQLVANFTAGMESQFDRLRRTLEEMAMIVDSYMPHSPAKRGPLSRIMEWGPALVGSLSEGIKKSMPQLEAAMRSLASVPASALAGGNTVSNYYNTSDNRVINITVQDGEDLLRTLHRLGVRIP